jgi:hypothetical protein
MESDLNNKNFHTVSSMVARSPLIGGERKSSCLDRAPMNRIDSLLPEDPRELSFSPSKTRSKFSGRDFEISATCQPFICIDGPKAWSLPLVRLTRISKSIDYSGPVLLDFIPFVSYLDTPFRLLGPTSIPLFFSDHIQHHVIL